ncbi:hypothetical protein EUGRSUZ_E00758 [Eucalyptus grandis]|uniref:Uncharacterized protein n=2 Tax=Eucalyptus grandis TaxID=71139 RepID=A0ACC3KSH1_EUCGR|nr:hypothetical protein EUGRSUZ_E00758 [Eucalyptus grandis]
MFSEYHNRNQIIIVDHAKNGEKGIMLLNRKEEITMVTVMIFNCHYSLSSQLRMCSPQIKTNKLTLGI